MINPDYIGGEQNFTRYYQGLMYYLDKINMDNQPCHYAIKSNFFPLAYTFNFLVPEQCPSFFYDRSAEVTDGWTEYSLEEFIDVLPEQYQMELENAMVKGLLTRIRDHGTGSGGRFFKTRTGAHWIVSARMMVIVGVEDLSRFGMQSKPMPEGYQPGVSYSTKL